MKIPTFLILLLTIATTHGAEKFAFAGDVAVLSGISGFHVEILRAGTNEFGLTNERLTTFAELRLRSAGIKVLTLKEGFQRPENPTLSIRLTAAEQPDLRRIVVYDVSISVRTTVRPKHGTLDRIVWATIYYQGAVGANDKEQFSTGILHELAGYMDTLCNDFLKANPKKE